VTGISNRRFSATFAPPPTYGTELKKFATLEVNRDKARRFDPVVCVAVKRQARIGNPKFDRITTNHAERNNLNIRLFNRRFTRKTLGYSKTLRNHSYSVALQVAYQNFCRVHHSLDGRTSAMAQEIADHAWTVEELLSATNP